jgi:hypothetical protein
MHNAGTQHLRYFGDYMLSLIPPRYRVFRPFFDTTELQILSALPLEERATSVIPEHATNQPRPFVCPPHLFGVGDRAPLQSRLLVPGVTCPDRVEGTQLAPCPLTEVS